MNSLFKPASTECVLADDLDDDDDDDDDRRRSTRKLLDDDDDDDDIDTGKHEVHGS